MQGRTLATRGGGRRKLIAIGGLTVLAFAIAVPMLAGGAAASVPSSDINDYGLYAYQTIKLKGGGTATESIIDGNIGAGTRHYVPGPIDEYTYGHEFLNNSKTPVPSGTPHITLCQGSGDNAHLTLINNSYVVAPSAQVNYLDQGTSFEPPTLLPSDPCQVPSVYADVLYKTFNIPQTAVHQTFTAPDINIPALPVVTCNSAKPGNSFVGATLVPGVYGAYDFAGTTTLSAGSYTFCSLTVEQNARLITQPGTIINVTGNLNLKGGGTGSVGACGTTFNIGSDVAFGRNGVYAGTFIAPNTDVSLGDSTLMVTCGPWRCTVTPA